jgi:hypothetical protein
LDGCRFFRQRGPGKAPRMSSCRDFLGCPRCFQAGLRRGPVFNSILEVGCRVAPEGIPRRDGIGGSWLFTRYQRGRDSSGPQQNRARDFQVFGLLRR